MSEETPAPALTWMCEAHHSHRHDDDDNDDDDDRHHNAPAASGTNSLGANQDSVSAKLTEAISDVLKQTQTAMENLLQPIQEIDANALDIQEQINQKRQMAMDRKVELERAIARFQKAASRVLQILHNVAAPDP